MSDVLTQGPTHMVRTSALNRIREQHQVNAFAEAQLRGYDITAPPVANPSAQEIALRSCSIVYQHARLIDMGRALLFTQGIDQALGLLAIHMAPSLARELQALRTQIPQERLDDVTQDYPRVMARNLVNVVQGHSRVKVADRHNDILLQCSRAKPNHDSMVVMIRHARCAPPYLQGLAVSTIMASLTSSTSSTIPAITHMVQDMCARYDALPELQLRIHTLKNSP